MSQGLTNGNCFMRSHLIARAQCHVMQEEVSIVSAISEQPLETGTKMGSMQHFLFHIQYDYDAVIRVKVSQYFN